MKLLRPTELYRVLYPSFSLCAELQTSGTANMNAASFFRLCRQQQLQPSLAANTRHLARNQLVFQTRTLSSSGRLYAGPVDGVAQSDPRTTQPSTDDKPTSLFYGNLAFGIEEETIVQAFSKYGTVKGVRLPKVLQRKSRNNSRKGWGGYNGGFCFVDFASHAEAGAALEAMNGVEIGDRAINLEYEKPSTARPTSDQTHLKKSVSKPSNDIMKTLSARDQEYVRTQPLVTGTVSRTGTMLKTVAVTTNHRKLDKYTKTHHGEEETELVHDPQCILVEGDVIKYQHFPPDLYAERAARGKTKVKFILKEVVTPFGIPIEERTPYVAAEQALGKTKSSLGSKD